MMPETFFKQRFFALQRCDFATVYRSYHPDAPFLQNFSGEEEYLEFAHQHLAGIDVKCWRCVKQRQHLGGSECILAMEFEFDGERCTLFELALLLPSGDGWGYHSAQKLGPADFPQDPAEIDFSHFDNAAEKIRF
jgi:SEC-C motif-containing protein